MNNETHAHPNSIEDCQDSAIMAYRKAAEVSAAARAHDKTLQEAVRSMRRCGVSTVDDPKRTT